jgi:hypothetical protein
MQGEAEAAQLRSVLRERAMAADVEPGTTNAEPRTTDAEPRTANAEPNVKENTN